MKRTIVLLPMVLCLLVVGADAQKKRAESLSIKLDRAVYNLHETVLGTVGELDAGEKFTVELVDAHGKVLARRELKRKGYKPTPFRMPIRRYTTTEMFVYVKGTSTRTAITKIRVTPPTTGWERVLLMVTEAGDTKGLTRADAFRELGITAGAGNRPAGVRTFDESSFRVLITASSSPAGFSVLPSGVAAALDNFNLREDKNDFSALARSASLADAGIVTRAVESLRTLVKLFAPNVPLGYVVLDAPGVSPNLAVDFSFDAPTLVAFRAWLQKRTKGVGTLSRAWDVKFRKWADVRPLTTQEILAREAKHFAKDEPMNFAPWTAHRRFMEEAFAERVAAVTSTLKNEYRGLRTGLSGALPPSAFGGCDWSLLVDTVEILSSDDRLTKRLLASLNRQRITPGYTFGTVRDGGRRGEFVNAVWTNVADGDLGIVINSGNALLNRDHTPTDQGYRARGTLLAVEGLGDVLMDREFTPAPTGVRVYVSQPSIRVQWMLDALSMGGSFRPGLRADDVWTSTWHREVLAWVDLLDDLNIAFEFLPDRALARAGWMRNVRVLILPKTVALSDDEVKQLERFVARGGMLIADSQPGLFDERGVTRRRPALDALFGVKRDGNRTGELAARFTDPVGKPFKLHKGRGRFKGLAEGVALDGLAAVEAKLNARNAPYHLVAGRTHALVTRTTGKGSAVYLNLSLINYPWDRVAPEKVAGLRELMRRTLVVAGVRAEAV